MIAGFVVCTRIGGRAAYRMRGATVVARTEGGKKSGRRMGGEREGKGRSRHDRHSGDESKRLSRFPVVHLKCYPGTHTHTTSKEKKKEILLDYTHTQNAIPSNSADSFFVYLLHSDNNNKITIFSPPFHGFNCSTVINPVGPSFCVNRRVLFLIQKVSSFQQQKRTKITKTIDRIQQSVEFGEECWCRIITWTNITTTTTTWVVAATAAAAVAAIRSRFAGAEVAALPQWPERDRRRAVRRLLHHWSACRRRPALLRHRPPPSKTRRSPKSLSADCLTTRRTPVCANTFRSTAKSKRPSSLPTARRANLAATDS